MTRVALALAVLSAAGVAPQTQRLFAQKYVTVVGNDGRPVAGLASEDFNLREGDTRRPTQGAEPASTPLAIELAIDGFEEAETPLFNAAIERARAALKTNSTQDRVIGVIGSRGAAFETLLDACAAIDKAPTDRRAIVAMFRQRGDVRVDEPHRLTDALLTVRASLWSIVLVDDQKNLSSALDVVLSNGAQMSGGRREIVTSLTSLADTETRFLQLLSSQYLVTFLWPDPMLSQINIVTRHDSGTVLAPVWNR